MSRRGDGSIAFLARFEARDEVKGPDGHRPVGGGANVETVAQPT